MAQAGAAVAESAMADVAVVGAGLAGLVCAQRLRQLGRRVVVVEKSRGLGGRLATRRLPGTCADHGVRYLAVQGPLTELLIQTLVQQNQLQPWLSPLEILAAGRHRPVAQTCYSASNGLTAVAKWLAAGLEIWPGQRLQQLSSARSGWQLELEAQNLEPKPPLLAQSVVMAIPAPQALTLLEPLSEQMPSLVQAIQGVLFDPCLTAIASYEGSHSLPWPAIRFPDSAELAWASLETSKGRDPQIPTLVVQSTAEFAKRYLEQPDLLPAGALLLQQLAKALSPDADWLTEPTQLQLHRWRYGFVAQPLLEKSISAASPHPLVCGGDWCGGSQTEAALASGLAAAAQIEQLLHPALATLPEHLPPELAFSALLNQLAAP